MSRRAGPGLASRHPIYVVLDNVRSLLNVGAVFRVCDAVQVERLYLCGITSHPARPDDPRPPWVIQRAERALAKTAIRALDAVPWEYQPQAAALISELKARGVEIVAVEQTPTSVDYTRARYQSPIALVFGHERDGIATPLLAQADQTIEIPMHGEGGSLNVAVAAGIVVYEVLRQLNP